MDPIETDDLDTDPALTSFLEEQARKHRAPGLSAGVIHGERTYGVTLGVTSTKDPLPVDADTMFMIGSTSKTITGTAIMRLADEGKVALTDRVIDHLTDFELGDAEVAKQVTVGQLLNHTAGWRGDGVPATGWGDDALARAVAEVADVPQEFGPGQYVSYNNAALLVAGRVVETLHGSTYEEAVTELVLTPLGMTSTFYGPWQTAQRRAAVGHILREDSEEAFLDWPLSRGIHPAGGALSSLRDQLTYARYHLDGATAGTAPLAEATRLAMQQPTASARSTITGVGVTWLLSQHGDVRLVTHGGNVSNLQTSSFAIAPDHGLAVTVMTNSRAGSAIGAAALDWCVQHYLGQPARPPLEKLPLTAELKADYVGRYDVGAWELAVTEADDKLFVQMVLPDGASDDMKAAFANPPAEVVLVGTDQVAGVADPVAPTGDFIRDADGSVRWFRSGMRMARRL